MRKILLTVAGAFFVLGLSAQTTNVATEGQDKPAKTCENKDAACCKKGKSEAKCCSMAHGEGHKDKSNSQLPAPAAEDRNKAPKPAAGVAPKS